MLFVIVADAAMCTALLLAGFLGGSLIMLAEALRGTLGYALECFTFVLLRRIHRGVLADMEFGAGKIEQIASAVIAVSMLLAAAWIGLNVLHIWSGQRELGAPIGLACAAIVGVINLYINVLAWDSVRRSTTADSSLIMHAQLRLRWVKLVASVVVGIGLTVSALSTDDVVVAWTDSLGGLFVAGYMVVHAAGVLRTAVPDLLDRSAGADVRGVVTRAVAAHAGDYARALRTRTRRSGRATFVEIHLAFDPNLSIAEVERRIETLRAMIVGQLPGAEVAVVATAAPGAAEAAS